MFKILCYNETMWNIWILNFATKDNFAEFLKHVEDCKNGNNETGLKEIFYFAIEDDIIVGHGSIRLNPEVSSYINIYGNIMYGVVPSKRKKTMVQ